MFELLTSHLRKKLEETKVMCLNCGHTQSMKIKKNEHTTYLCKCGMRILYPPTSKRDFHTCVFISYPERQTNLKIKKNKIEINSFKDYEKVFNEICEELGVLPETKRAYSKFKRRAELEERRFSGKYT